MRTVKRVLWVLVVVGALCGVYIMVQTFRKAETADEQTACAAIAIAFALIPYCLARAVSEITSRAD